MLNLTGLEPERGFAWSALPNVQRSIGDGSPIVFTRWKGERRASGSLVRAGRTTRFGAIAMELRQDRRATLTVLAPRRLTLVGSWSRRDRRTVALVFPGRASGTVDFMDRANPYRWRLSGPRLRLSARAQE